MAPETTTLYTVNDCHFSYRGHPCLKDIELHLDSGKFYGLIGPNGSGKTTLLNLLSGFNRADSGRIDLLGTPVRDYGKSSLAKLLSHVPQSFAMEFDYTVYEVVMMGRHPYIPRFSRPGLEDVRLVTQALETLDIAKLKDRYVTCLSGGERQRVLVARALAQNTPLMILDEATASLDVRHSIDIMQALSRRVREKAITAIAAIHDLDLAAAFCDELIVIADGTIRESGKVSEVLNTTLLREIFQVEAEVTQAASGPPHILYRYMENG